MQQLSEASIQVIGECSATGFLCCSFDHTLSILYENCIMKSMIGEDNIKSLFWLDYIHSQDRSLVWNYFLKLPIGENGQVNHRIGLEDGSTGWLSAKVKKIRLSNEAVVIFCYYDKIMPPMEETLFYKNIKVLANPIEEVPCGIFKAILDEDLSIIYANEKFYETFGYKSEESSNIQNLQFLLKLSEFTKIKNDIKTNIAAHKYHFELEFLSTKKEGESIWVFVRCSYSEEDNQIIGAIFDMTSRKKAAERLRVIAEEERIALLQSDNTICRYDVQDKRMHIPKDLAKSLGIAPMLENILNEETYLIFVAKESIGQYLDFFREMELGKENGSCLIKTILNRGISWVKGYYTLLYDSENNPVRAIISFSDCTKAYEKEIVYKRWQQVYKAQKKGAISNYECDLSSGTVETLEGLMYPVSDDLKESYSLLLNYIADNFIVKEDRKRYKETLARERLLMLHSQGIDEIKCEHQRVDNTGYVFWAVTEVQMIVDPYARVVKAFLLIKDIDKEKRQAIKLKQLSETDWLTGLYNRRTVIQKINNLILKGDGTEEHAFIIVDIDYLKGLNDNFGHQFGDSVIVETAMRLKETLRNDGFCGRLGGDEFVIFIENIGDEKILLKKLDLLRCRLEKKYDNDCFVTGSLGLSKYPSDGVTFQELYEKADKALYSAKKQGRNQFVVYKDISE